MMRKNLRILISLVLGLVVILSLGVAQATWSSEIVTRVQAGHDWFGGIEHTKSTSSSTFGAQATYKEMTSNPKVKIVNSSGDDRSGVISLADEDVEYYTTQTGSQGYKYTSKTKPAWNQIGEKELKYKVDVR